MTDTIIIENSFDTKVLDVHREKFGALDIETDIVENPWAEQPTLVSIAVTFDGTRAFVFGPEWVGHLRPMLEHTEWVMHNGLFDRLMLKEFFGVDAPLKHDTMAMQYLLDPDEPKSLEALSIKYLGLGPYKDVDYKNILDEPFEKVAEMNGEDACRTYNLFRPLADLLNEDKGLSRVYQWLLMPAVNTLIEVTQAGIPVDEKRLDAITVEYDKEVVSLLESLRDTTPSPHGDVYPNGWPKPSWWRIKEHGQYEGQLFNPASSHQVRHILFDLWGLPPLEYTKDKDGNETDTPSTNKDVLLQLETYFTKGKQQEWLHRLREYRVSNKMLSTLRSYPKYMDSDGWIHPRYKPLHVVTGRLSSEKINIQNVPRDKAVRECFGNVLGYDWMKADYSQIELRIAAMTAREETMLRAYREGEDLHRLTGKLVLGDDSDDARQVGKTLNFGLLYGAGPSTLQRVARSDYGVFLTEEQARYYRDEFFRAYPGLQRWHDAVEAEVTVTGEARSLLGRVRYVPNAKVPWYVEDMRTKKLGAIREATNHPIQSLASDLLLGSLIRVAPEVSRWGAKVVAEVHDEIDLLVPQQHTQEVASFVKDTMEDVSWLRKFGIKLTVPVVCEVEVGSSWGVLSEI
jgi:DNA polymerase-1